MTWSKRMFFSAIGGLLVASSISGCGGSSDSEPSNSSEPPDFEVPQSGSINDNSSHAGRTTDLWISYQDFRAEFGGDHTSFGDAIAYADFDGDGYTDVFIAPGTSLYDSVPLEFYRNLGDGSFELNTEDWIMGEIPELPHPRKSLIADFNDNGKPDILISDHGPEQEPEFDFPGGHVWLLLSTEDGRYEPTQLTSRLGFYHGASAADVTGNGLLDIFITDSPSWDRDSEPELFLNQGDGVYQRAPERLASDVRNLTSMYTTEVYDVDEDGYADIIVAGHEQDGMASRVLWGGPSGHYSLSRSTVLPAVANWGTVVDISLADLNGSGLNDLVLTRTGGGNNNFYQGYYIQVIKQENNREFTDVTADALNGSESNANSNWIRWTRLQDISGNGRPDILVDNKWFCLRWDNDGSGQFNAMTDACNLSF